MDNDRQKCVSCGASSPATETEYTLISSKFGWRLSRQANPDGTYLVEWRCPACWRAHKAAQAGNGKAPSSTHLPVAPPSRPRSDTNESGEASPPSGPSSQRPTEGASGSRKPPARIEFKLPRFLFGPDKK